MALEGIDAAKQITTINTEKNAGTSSVKEEKLNSAFGDEIKTKNEMEGEISYLPKDPVSADVEKQDKMSRKEAKEWLKQYREENGCSKKEAKAAFEAEFGYKFPMNKFAKGMAMIGLQLVMVPGAILDLCTGGKLGYTDTLRDVAKS